MAERVTIRAGVGGSWPIRFLIVADSAGCNLASRTRFTRRCVARVAIVVCSKICGNRQSNAAIDGRAVTTCAAFLRTRCAGHVLSVVKLDVERLVKVCRKIFQRWIVTANVGMTDDAHRYLRCCELATMAIGARFVTGEARRG